MQTIFLTGNLAADCEIVKGRDEREFIKFTVAANEFKNQEDQEAKPVYYVCRMGKTGVAELLLKGRFVSLCGSLSPSLNVKDGKSYLNLDVWVSHLDLGPASGRPTD